MPFIPPGGRAFNEIEGTITEERDEEAEFKRIYGKINRTPRPREGIDKTTVTGENPRRLFSIYYT